jgi:hypothetical protein
MSEAERQAWRMPPIALLKPAEWSTGRKVALLTLRGYLVISVLLLIVKAVRLGGGLAVTRTRQVVPDWWHD